jgi:hypothetical protein
MCDASEFSLVFLFNNKQINSIQLCGTDRYTPVTPILLEEEVFDDDVDIYCFAVISTILFTNKIISPDNNSSKKIEW